MILVTGAASGIGAALMALLGAAAIGLDRADTEIVCDLADPASIRSVAAAVPAGLRGIAHVAGLPGTADPRAILAVNALAPALLTKALLPALSDGAAIVAVSSVTAARCDWDKARLDQLLAATTAEALAAVDGMEGARAYELSKALLNRWVVRSSAALHPRGIRVNAVSPGPVETPSSTISGHRSGRIGSPRPNSLLGAMAALPKWRPLLRSCFRNMPAG